MPKKEHWTDYSIIISSGLTYCFVFFYRGSLTPILDVLEEELHTTSSGIGLMSSLFWAGYFMMQLPSGFILEIFTQEFIILFGLLSLTATSFLFAFSTNILYASIILTTSGILVSSGFLAMISLIAQKLGNNYIPVWNGIIYFFTYCFLFGMNTLQSYVWDNYGIWRETYYVLSGLCLFLSILFVVLNLFNYNYYKNNIPVTSHYKIKPDNIEVSQSDQQRKSCLPICRIRDDVSSFSSKCSLLKIALCNHWNYIIGVYMFCLHALPLAFNGLWLTVFLMTKYDYERSMASIVSNTFYFSSAFCGVIMGKLSTKYKRKKIFMVIASLFCCCSILIIYLPANTHVAVIIVLNCISGAGCGVFSICDAITREYNEYYNCSDVSGGIVNTISTSAGFILQFIIGYLIDVSWTKRNGEINENGDRIYVAEDYEFGFIIIPIVLGVAFILSLVAKETYGQNLEYNHKKSSDVTGVKMGIELEETDETDESDFMMDMNDKETMESVTKII
eukprot:555676_1